MRTPLNARAARQVISMLRRFIVSSSTFRVASLSPK